MALVCKYGGKECSLCGKCSDDGEKKIKCAVCGVITDADKAYSSKYFLFLCYSCYTAVTDGGAA